MLPSEETPLTEQDDFAAFTDTDRFPHLQDVLAVIQDLDEAANGPVERLEITCLASGEATYRIWPPRAEDPVGGYIAEI